MFLVLLDKPGGDDLYISDRGADGFSFGNHMKTTRKKAFYASNMTRSRRSINPYLSQPGRAPAILEIPM